MIIKAEGARLQQRNAVEFYKSAKAKCYDQDDELTLV